MANVNAQYCTKDLRYTDAQFFDTTQLTVATNVQYGLANDFQGTPYPLRMDLYYPNLGIDVSPKRPFILLFHGGGFSSGDKQSGDIKDLCIQMALRGFVCASVNYRIGHDFSEYGEYKARYRAIQDGHAALRYIVNNANTVRIDTSWLFVGGQSAGSLLALGMVYADQNELDSVSLLYNGTATSVELGNLLTSGNSLTNTYSIKGVFNNWGGVVKSEMDKEEMLPTIAFHGELDTLVQIGSDNSFLHYTLSGSRAIHDVLFKNAICSEINIDTLGEHGIYRNASTVFRAQRASCFFKSVFCKTCSNFYTTDSVPASCSSATGIGENFNGATIKIFPNPFEGAFRIEGLEGPTEYTMMNCYGKIVKEGLVQNGMIEAEVCSGIYFLTLRREDTYGLIIYKMVKN